MIEIAVQQFAGICILLFFVGAFIGVILNFCFGTTKCEHNWEKIIETNGRDGSDLVVVHMCKKCGKRKYTRV